MALPDLGRWPEGEVPPRPLFSASRDERRRRAVVSCAGGGGGMVLGTGGGGAAMDGRRGLSLTLSAGRSLISAQSPWPAGCALCGVLCVVSCWKFEKYLPFDARRGLWSLRASRGVPRRASRSQFP